MAVVDEGVIKYDQSNFKFIPPLPVHEYRSIEKYRKMVRKINLIGVYEEVQLGFGNISQRKDYTNIHATTRPQFIVSGTQTGHLYDLGGEHYTRVIDFDIDEFSVTAQGAVRASSETVTHASIFQSNPNIRGIIHFHHPIIWKHMLEDDYPSTGRWILYGTYEMALAVKDCVGDNTQGLFAMRGHEDGGVAYGPSLNAAMNIVAQVYKKYVDKHYRL
jgi:ribulose-5-phosphate 4-epimerase/fuculose-1-phosphate aldolase